MGAVSYCGMCGVPIYVPESKSRHCREDGDNFYCCNGHRVGAGVCPCCKRTFQQLARHMKCKHPKYRTEGPGAVNTTSKKVRKR